MLSEIILNENYSGYFERIIIFVYAGMNVDIKMLSSENESYISYKNIILKLRHISYLMKVILNKKIIIEFFCLRNINYSKKILKG